LGENASETIRSSAGHSLKSYISHTWIRDRRSDVILPSSGYLLKLRQELAGFGGDVEFHKHEAEVQAAVSAARFVSNNLAVVADSSQLTRDL
jgi:outer membrane protein insertion porin family